MAKWPPPLFSAVAGREGGDFNRRQTAVFVWSRLALEELAIEGPPLRQA